MKKSIFIALIIFPVLCGITQTIRAQESTRIQFEKGKSSTAVKGTTGPYGKSFVLRARSGQKLIIKLTPVSGIGVKVGTVGRFGEMVLLRETRGGTYEVGLEETGDYTIFVGATGRNPVSFTLSLQIVKMTDI